jgi:hypothetical protein
MNPFIGAAEWTELAFHLLYQPEGRTALPTPGVATNRAVRTHLGEGFVE